MAADFKRFTDFFLELGADAVAHTEKNYLAHVVGVGRYMEQRGCTEELCHAGLFHSIYGTEAFQRFALPLERRGEVRALIGERAERLAYLNCAMDRATFDKALFAGTEPYRFTDRLSGVEVALSKEDFDDLCRVHLYDFLEQVPRSRRWDYRRAAYRRMAERLGGVALESFDRTYALEQPAPAV